MDASEAREILAERLARYRGYTHEHLARLVDSQEVEECRSKNGRLYQLEFQFFWDAKPGGEVRVVGSIDDGGLRAFYPLSDDFIKASDGSFVGE